MNLLRRTTPRRKAAPRPYLVVRAGSRDLPAFLDPVFPEAPPVEAARRAARLAGPPPGILVITALGVEGNQLPVELLDWLDELPAGVRVVATIGPEAPAALKRLAAAVDAVIIDVYEFEQAPPGAETAGVSPEEFCRLYRLLHPYVEVVGKLWVGRETGELGPDHLRLEQLCTTGLENGLRLALHFGDGYGPASPAAVKQFCRLAKERFPHGGLDWGGFAATASYRRHLREMSAELGFSPWGWDLDGDEQERLARSELLL